VIVDEGTVYLQCIDSFEDIFEMKKDSCVNLELADILEPELFDNHRDIINALFEVYLELSNEYV